MARDGTGATVEEVVEIPKGSRNKDEVDHATGIIRLDRARSPRSTTPLITASSPVRRRVMGIRSMSSSTLRSLRFPAVMS
jgi:hypothetical protein